MQFLKNILKRDINKGAFSGHLLCPFCRSPNQRHIGNISEYRRRYQCKKCGGKYQYDFSNNPNAHPYAPFKKPSFQEILRYSKSRKT